MYPTTNPYSYHEATGLVLFSKNHVEIGQNV